LIRVIEESRRKYKIIIRKEMNGPNDKKESIKMKPAMYPQEIEPESPRKICALGLLYLIKARNKDKTTKLRN
jgi:hypothetical protein